MFFASSTFLAHLPSKNVELDINLLAPAQCKFKIFGDDSLCRNRFSMMCTAEVSINIMNAFYGLEYKNET